MPWEHALMAFFEFYSMSIPLLMPDASWSYRLIFDCRRQSGKHITYLLGCPAPSATIMPVVLQFILIHRLHFKALNSRRYWYQYSSFAQFPHITRLREHT